MEVSDPTKIRKLVTEGVNVSEISDKLKLVVFMLNLYYWGVPLSRLGQWVGVHKTTVLRWILGLVFQLWPLIYSWIIKRVKGSIVYVDEKWIRFYVMGLNQAVRKKIGHGWQTAIYDSMKIAIEKLDEIKEKYDSTHEDKYKDLHIQKIILFTDGRDTVSKEWDLERLRVFRK